MSALYQLSEQRHHVRYRPKDPIFITIQGHHSCKPVSVTDFNRNGVGLFSTCEENEITGKFIILDLISSQDRAILRFLSARVVFSAESESAANNPLVGSKRYGLQFVNLSALQKRQLDLITKKYTLRE